MVLTVPWQDRRLAPRSAHEEALLIRIIGSQASGFIEGETVRGSTQDISATGLRIRLKQPLPIGTALQLCIKVAACPGEFLVDAVIRSVREESTSVFLAGVELREDPNDDVKGWQRMLDEVIKSRNIQT